MNHLGRSLALSFIALLGVASSSVAQERRQVPLFRTYGLADTESAEAVQTFIEDFKDAWSRQDTNALIALHAEDVEWINAYARLFQGAEPLGAFLERQLFPSFTPEVSRQEAANMRTISIRYVGDDVAIIHLYTDGERGPSRNESENVRRTHLHLVLEDQDGDWKIVHTAIMDARN